MQRDKVVKKVLHISAVFVLSIAVFINTFQNGFTYDDYPTILENKEVIEADVVKVLTGGRGIRQLTFMIDYKLFGPNPAGYHVENTLIHAVNSCLVYGFILLFPSISGAAFPAALIFAVHPVHVEAVAGIANRKDLLALLFILLSSISYIAATRMKGRRKKTGLVLLTAFFYILSLLSKENAVVLPVVLIIYDFMFLEKKDRIIGRLAIPIILIGSIAGYKVARIYIVDFLSRPETSMMGYKPVFLTSLSAFPLNIRYLLFPLQLSADHTINISRTFLEINFILALFFLLAYLLTALVYIRDRSISFMLIWIVIFLLPTSNLLPLSSYFFAERYLYAPSLGFCALMGRLCSAKRSFAALTSLTVLLSLFAGLTVVRNHVWKDEFTLWSDTAKKSPRSVFAHNNLGNVYNLKGDATGAVREYEKTLELAPRHPEALYNLGNLYYTMGEREKALNKFKLFLTVWKGEERIRKEVEDKVNILSENR